MIIERVISVDRLDFASHAEAKWLEMRGANSKSANRHERAKVKITEYWDKQGLLSELLFPLLDSSSVEIRLAAAGHLMNLEDKSKAKHVIQELIDDSDVFIAQAAKAILRVHDK